MKGRLKEGAKATAIAFVFWFAVAFVLAAIDGAL